MSTGPNSHEGAFSAIELHSPGVHNHESPDPQSVFDAIQALLSDPDLITRTLNESLELLYDLLGMASEDTGFIERRKELVTEILPSAVPAYTDTLSLVTNVIEITEYCKEYSESNITAERAVSHCQKTHEQSENVAAVFGKVFEQLSMFKSQIEDNMSQVSHNTGSSAPREPTGLRRWSIGREKPHLPLRAPPANQEIVSRRVHLMFDYFRKAVDTAQNALRRDRLRMTTPHAARVRSTPRIPDVLGSLSSLVHVTGKSPPSVPVIESKTGTMPDLQRALVKFHDGLKILSNTVQSIRDFTSFIIEEFSNRYRETEIGEVAEPQVSKERTVCFKVGERAEEIFERCNRFSLNCCKSENLMWAIIVRFDTNLQRE